MSSCASSATATLTSVLTLELLTTTFTSSLTTLPPTFTTITSQGCALGNLSDVACLSTATTITSTIPGITSTVDVPVITTVPSLSTHITTLFGTSCSASASVSLPVSSSRSVISTPPPPPSPSVTPSSSMSAVVVTSQQSSTLANGQVTVVPLTVVSVVSGSITYVTAAASADPHTQTNTDGGSPPTIGPIIGGVLGGFFGLFAIVSIIWFVLRRRQRWDDIFNEERPPAPAKRFSLDPEVEPKPYQYGLVGQARTPPSASGFSPPNSPPASSANRHPTPGLMPLNLPRTVSSPGFSATTASSRPSSAGSMRPLDPGAHLSGHGHNTSKGSIGDGAVPAIPYNWGHHSPSPSADQAYFDRAGSPTSVREYDPPRRLMLANGSTHDPPSPSSSPPRTRSALNTSDSEAAVHPGAGRASTS
ncbi:unnamed protein product [Mycena citricolor]|uniref:Uncharacterized protein n=1 Tax=Mycena citricolor TaxID=2018698 RepID=A0AAD2GZB3_9AGAR|nr:unnamed protein product [Mycena citricolor]